MFRYDFEKNGRRHGITTEKKLNELEIKMLGEILASFPHSSNKEWLETFAKLQTDEIPKDLLLLAANACDLPYGNTVLGIAAETGLVAPVQRLIDMGAKINEPDKSQKLPLHWAINNGLSFHKKKSFEAVKVVECLLNNGARVDITCYKNMTPYEYAKDRGLVAAASLLSDEAIHFRKKQFLLFKGLKSIQSDLKIPSGNTDFVRKTLPIISDFLRPKIGK